MCVRNLVSAKGHLKTKNGRVKCVFGPIRVRLLSRVVYFTVRLREEVGRGGALRVDGIPCTYIHIYAYCNVWLWRVMVGIDGGFGG